MESFRPIVSFKKSEDGWTELIARLMALMILVFLVYKLGQEPQIIKGIVNERKIFKIRI
jgi:hypothetical protein